MNRVIALLVCLAFISTGCGSSDADAGSVASGDTISATSDESADNQQDEDGVVDDASAEADSPPSPPADGRYEVGDTYFDVDLSATYLGLAEIPIDPVIFTGGRCFTVLVEVNRYADTIGLGPEKFRPSTTGILADGTEATKEPSGLGCDMNPLAELGYERSITTGVDLGDTVKAYVGSIHVPDGATLAGVTLYGSEDTLLVAEVTVDATN